MPFTLITDELVGVNPDAHYVLIAVKNNEKYEKWIVSKYRLNDLMLELKIKDYKIINTLIW